MDATLEWKTLKGSRILVCTGGPKDTEDEGFALREMVLKEMKEAREKNVNFLLDLRNSAYHAKVTAAWKEDSKLHELKIRRAAVLLKSSLMATVVSAYMTYARFRGSSIPDRTKVCKEESEAFEWLCGS